MKLDKATIAKLKLYKKAKKAQRKLRNRTDSTKQQRDSWKQTIAKAMLMFPTGAEAKLQPAIAKLGFVSQHQVCGYIADFAHIEKKIIVEVDGSVHLKQRGYDEHRDRVLSAHGWFVMRFPNSAVSQNLSQVCDLIRRQL